MLEESASAIPSSLWAYMNSWFTPTVLFVLLNLMIVTIFCTSSFSNKKAQNKHSSNDFPHLNNIARSPSVLQRLKSVNFYTHFRSQEPQQDSSLHNKHNPDSDALFNAYQSPNLETQEHYFFQHDSHHENAETVHESQTQYVLEHNPRERQTQFDFQGKEASVDDFQVTREEGNDEESSEQSMDEVFGQLTDSHFTRTKSDTEPSGGEIPTKLSARMRKSASLKSAFGHFEEENIVEARRPATAREKGSAKVTNADEGVDAKADDFINRFKHQLKLQRLDSILRGNCRLRIGKLPSMWLVGWTFSVMLWFRMGILVILLAFRPQRRGRSLKC